jgi:formiminotetrahydrofolate cyclodeaminase
MRMEKPSDSSNDSDPYLKSSVGEFLDLLADRTPAPGGGAAAALTCAMAAGLVEMATSYGSARGLERTHDRARQLRLDAQKLAHADGVAYGAVLEALRLPPGDDRHQQLDVAVGGAIASPMAILEIASEVATLAADVAETGNRNLEGDALTGALLAEAASRSAATLAQLNLSMLSRHAVVDAHLEDLRPALARATRARERAVSAYAAM